MIGYTSIEVIHFALVKPRRRCSSQIRLTFHYITVGYRSRLHCLLDEAVKKQPVILGGASVETES